MPTRPLNKKTILGELAQIGHNRRLLERQEDQLAPLAREAGATWAEIAAALGVSRQAVHKRHGKPRS